MSEKEAWIEALQDEFGDEAFTSIEATEVLDIEWSEFMETFVNLQQDSGRVQRTGTRGNESVYRVVDDADPEDLVTDGGTDHPADQALDEVLDELTGDADVFGAARQGALKMHERWIEHDGAVHDDGKRLPAGMGPKEALETRMDYIIQSFSDLHAKWGRTRRRDEPELVSMKEDAKLLEESVKELQIAIDLYRAEIGGWTDEQAEDGGDDADE